MATIAVGDIHGNLPALADLLRQLESIARQDDVVVFLGDYIDRGPQAKQCVDAILAFQQDIPAEVVCLCGNHEDWLLRTLHDHQRHSWLLVMEAYSTIRSYSPAAERVLREAASQASAELYSESRVLPYEAFFDCVPDAHIRFFEGLRTYYQGPGCLCTHGGLDPRVPAVQEQTRYSLIWGANGFPEKYSGPDIVVYGHRNNAVLDADGWPAPAILGRTIGIDTISHGVLTAVRLPDQLVLQSARYERRR
jgi:serine/threonine protein phosphatase 1